MSELKMETIINYLPELSEKIPVTEKKFLFFFDSIILDEEKFLFGFSLKTGVQAFSIITFINAINAFLDIFVPYSLWLLIISLFAFIIHFLISFYSFASTITRKASYAKISYIIISIIFIIEAVYYISRSILKIIEFMTPWDRDFLQLDFLIYVFGYGIFLFIYLYFIYVLYLYALQLQKEEFYERNEDLYSENGEENENLEIKV